MVPQYANAARPASDNAMIRPTTSVVVPSSAAPESLSRPWRYVYRDRPVPGAQGHAGRHRSVGGVAADVGPADHGCRGGRRVRAGREPGTHPGLMRGCLVRDSAYLSRELQTRVRPLALWLVR